MASETGQLIFKLKIPPAKVQEAVSKHGLSDEVLLQILHLVQKRLDYLETNDLARENPVRLFEQYVRSKRKKLAKQEDANAVMRKHDESVIAWKEARKSGNNAGFWDLYNGLSKAFTSGEPQLRTHEDDLTHLENELQLAQKLLKEQQLGYGFLAGKFDEESLIAELESDLAKGRIGRDEYSVRVVSLKAVFSQKLAVGPLAAVVGGVVDGR